MNTGKRSVKTDMGLSDLGPIQRPARAAPYQQASQVLQQVLNGWNVGISCGISGVDCLRGFKQKWMAGQLVNCLEHRKVP